MNKSCRQISNKKNIFCIIVGIVLIVSSIIEILKTIFFQKLIWPNKKVDLVFFLIGIIGVFVCFLGVLNYFNVKSCNKYLEKLEYKFDYQKEFSTYRIIGLKNKKNNNGAITFYKYSEWKNYLEEEFCNWINYEDAYRFMKRRLRNKESYKELFVTVMLPLEVSLFATFFTLSSNAFRVETIVALLITVLILSAIMTFEYVNCKEEIYFMYDFIEIVFPKFNKKCESDNMQ